MEGHLTDLSRFMRETMRKYHDRPRTNRDLSDDEVFGIIEKYYPRNRIRPVTQFFIEELFENDQHKTD